MRRGAGSSGTTLHAGRPLRENRNMRTLPAIFLGLLVSRAPCVPARAQDVHMRVSPAVKTGIEGTTEFPTIQMPMDHHP